MDIADKILNDVNLEFGEALDLYTKSGTAYLMYLGNEVRKKKNPGNKAGWIIDRNVNITNVCTSRCKFCNFHRTPKSGEAYITTMDEYRTKIKELYELGGDQLLLQGGMHPDLRLDFYTGLFSSLKNEFPDLKLHTLGPPEIHDLAKKENVGYDVVLKALLDAGMDSLPGAGAEILCDEVRQKISAAKAGSEEWLEVMRIAHQLNIPTSATMMYGHIESLENRLEHLFRLRDLQAIKPAGSYGFINFVPWPFQAKETRLKKQYPGSYFHSAEEYLRLIAVSRIILHNIRHIQASWLTVGLPTAQIALHGGADDLGSIMIEENVVSAAGASFRANSEEIQKVIVEAGFEPARRNQKYEYL